MAAPTLWVQEEREALPSLVRINTIVLVRMLLYANFFCESDGKSAKRDLGVAVVLPRGVFTPLDLSPLGLPVLFPRRRHFVSVCVCVCVCVSPLHF